MAASPRPIWRRAGGRAFSNRRQTSLVPPGRGTVQDLLGRVFGVVSGTLGALGSALVIFFTGLYLAVDPQTYRHGLVRLVPIRHHLRADEILDQMGDTLLWWLIGKLISMTLVGVLTFLGLWFLDIPLRANSGPDRLRRSLSSLTSGRSCRLPPPFFSLWARASPPQATWSRFTWLCKPSRAIS